MGRDRDVPGFRYAVNGVSIGTPSPFTVEPGFFTRAAILDAYARSSGRDVEAIEFYQVLALYKLAVISEGIYARHLQGKTVGEGFAGMTRAADALAGRALAIADTAADRRLREGSPSVETRPAHGTRNAQDGRGSDTRPGSVCVPCSVVACRSAGRIL